MSKNARTIVAILMTVGGLMGLAGVLMAQIYYPATPGLTESWILIGVLSGLGFVAALLVVRAHPWAYGVASLFYMLQVPILFSKPLSYVMISGFGLYMNVGAATGMGWMWGQSCMLSINPGHDPTIGINIFAYAMLMYLQRARRMDSAKVTEPETPRDA